MALAMLEYTPFSSNLDCGHNDAKKHRRGCHHQRCRDLCASHTRPSTTTKWNQYGAARSVSPLSYITQV